MSKHILAAFVFSALGTFVSGCANVREPQPTALNQGLVRTSKEREALQKAADAGDGAAAYQLFQYYAFVEFDKQQYTYWLERAVSLNYRPAIVGLGNLLCESSDPQERRRGQKLLRQAGAEDPTVAHGSKTGSPWKIG
jgi:TPR repeat protein